MLFADPERRAELLAGDRDQLDAYVGELLDLRASAKFLWPIPDTGVGRRLVRIDSRVLVATSEHDRVVARELGDLLAQRHPGAPNSEKSEVPATSPTWKPPKPCPPSSETSP